MYLLPTVHGPCVIYEPFRTINYLLLTYPYNSTHYSLVSRVSDNMVETLFPR